MLSMNFATLMTTPGALLVLPVIVLWLALVELRHALSSPRALSDDAYDREDYWPWRHRGDERYY